MLIGYADANVCRIGLAQIVGQFPEPGRSDDLHRRSPPCPETAQPAAEPEVRQSVDMVRVIVRDENRRHLSEGQLQLIKPGCYASSCIKQQVLIRGLDERGGAGPLWLRDRASRPQQSDPDLRFSSACCDARK